MFQTAQEIQSFTYNDPSEACVFRCPLNKTCHIIWNLPFKSPCNHAFSSNPYLWTLKKLSEQQKAVEEEKQGDCLEVWVDDIDNKVEFDDTDSSEATGKKAQRATSF